MILLDSNILIDVIETDPVWCDWSFAKLDAAAKHSRVVINAIVVAEAAPRGESLESFLERLSEMAVEIEQLCEASAYCAGVAFQEYRRRRAGTAATSVLADFLIGGHAAILGATILTRDPRFYRSYFPQVPLITPDHSGE